MKKCNQSGQTLIENVIVNLILLLCSFSVIEVSRLLAFKSYLQVLATDAARQISFSHLSLIRDGVIPGSQKDNRVQNKIFERKVKKEIEKKIGLFQTSLFSFDKKKSIQNQNFLYLEQHKISLQLEFVNENQLNRKSKYMSGVYLKINSCLPVLFSGYFRRFMNYNTKIPQIGKKINDKNLKEEEKSRNCLGYYSSLSVLEPLFWFRVRSAAYFPWPASSSIYTKGFAFSNNIFGIENKYREDVFQSLENLDLSLFFNEIGLEL